MSWQWYHKKQFTGKFKRKYNFRSHVEKKTINLYIVLMNAISAKKDFTAMKCITNMSDHMPWDVTDAGSVPKHYNSEVYWNSMNRCTWDKEHLHAHTVANISLLTVQETFILKLHSAKEFRMSKVFLQD